MSSSSRLKAIRNASATITLAAVVTLGLVAAESGGTVTRHTTVVKGEAAAKRSAPSPAVSADPALPDTTPAAVTSSPLPATSGSTSPAVIPIVTSPASSAASAAPPAATTTAVVGSGLTANSLPACPLPLPAPATDGGLQSLIGLSPLFGPFSAEAFASAATFQPLLELFGPFLVAFAQQYAVAQPALAPVLLQFEGLENQGYTLLAPFYGPYRTKFLSAETALATALAPVATALVDNPAASCVVDLENVLTTAG